MNKIYRNTKKSKNGTFTCKIKASINENIEMICKLKNVEKTAWCNDILEKAVNSEVEKLRRIINE